jgi:hypothetical protein
MTAVCWRCTQDEYLKKIIREEGTLEECSLCKRTDENAFGPDDLAKVLDPVLHDNFLPYSEGGPLSNLLKEFVIGQNLGFEDKIFDALEANEKVRLQPGQEPFFHRCQKYMRDPWRTNEYDARWDDLLDQLKHRRRFFNGSAKELFADLFDGIERRTCWTGNAEDRNVVWNFPQGSELYRARICKSPNELKGALSDPFKNVGPPPPEMAPAGRMNAEGVPVFYGSLDLQTCVAETRPAIGNNTAVIRLATTKVLRLLDFDRLGKSYLPLSYFQPDFAAQCGKGDFISGLQRRISEPIVPGREADYIITQTLAEYLAHVHDCPFDGIVFDSVQRKDGKNIVLFPDVEGVFPLSYVDNSVTLYSTRSIEYVHEEQFVLLTRDGEILVFPDDDEEE